MANLITIGLGESTVELEGGTAFLFESISSTSNVVSVTFNHTFTISGPGADPTDYIFTTEDGIDITAVSLVVNGDILEITTTEQTTGATYTLNLPEIGIVSTNDKEFNGIFDPDFTGDGGGVEVLISRAVHARALDVYFTVAVREEGALDPDNYSITSGVEVISVVKITDTQYRLTTTKMDNDVSYTVTTENITSLGGND